MTVGGMATAIIYICNAGYLVPALVSASAARKHSPRDQADVFIFDVGPKTAEGKAIEKAAAQRDVRYVWVGADVLEGLHPTYGRLLVDRFLPDAYSDFIYLDSDTQVLGRLDELVALVPPSGKLVAVRDPMSLLLALGEGYGDEHKTYMANLGLQPAEMKNYFNTGVFKVDRKTWSTFAPDILKLVRQGRPGKYVDQDFINIVCKGAAELVSMRWNFPGFMLWLSPIVADVEPRLVHFMSNPRPWHGPFLPWGREGWRPYSELAQANPELAPYWPKLKPLKYLKYAAQQRYKYVMERPSWMSPKLREYISSSEKSLVI
jgi:lipopolysaccharide biosynthesis glycosyltransferase